MTVAARQAEARPLRVVFRVAAGPRQGYGHLVRAARLAAALGVRFVVSVRGGREATRVARRLGAIADLRPLAAVIAARRPRVLVVDDPAEAPARAALCAARRRGVATVGVYDLGRGCLDADLVVDGSLPGGAGLARVESRRRRCGPSYMILDPRLGRWRRRRGRPPRWDVLITLGGGARSTVALRLARRLVAGVPRRRVAVAPGFRPLRGRAHGFAVLAPGAPVGAALAAASVAVVAGGVTAYEAAALGVPAVLVAVVGAQRATTRAFVERGAAVDGGAAASRVASLARLTRAVDRLLAAPARRRALGAAGRRLVDGRGARRVAALVERLARQRP